MDDRDRSSNRTSNGIPDVVFECVLPYIRDPRDRGAISLVCRHWYELDALTRKDVTIAFCYSTTAGDLRKRFHHLESLKLKGKPRASMFNLIPDDWGGYATPWIHEIAESFDMLKSVHFRRMIVRDPDLILLAESRSAVLRILRLDKCSGFSTDGLLYITRLCRNLITLNLEESTVDEKDGDWLHQLALHNTVLESLNFYLTGVSKIKYQDLELLAKSCPSLISVKIDECEISKLNGFFRNAFMLEEFGGGSYNDRPENYSNISFPPNLSRLSLTYMSMDEMHIIFPFASRLKKLDLIYAFLDAKDHYVLIQKCPNLEILEMRNVIGDTGLEAISRSCKKLRRLRVECGGVEHEMLQEEGVITQTGLFALARGCPELEYLAIYVSDVTNAALECIGSHLNKLTDFRLVLLNVQETVADLPLDHGVRALLTARQNLRRFALYLRPGGLTDSALGDIGRLARNVTWMLMGALGQSDAGLLEFSKGCPNLRRLEIRNSFFTEHALAVAATQLRSLIYFWVQGYRATSSGQGLSAMARPFWNTELITSRYEVDGEVAEEPGHVLAYYSLADPRMDFPDTVFPLRSL